MPLTGFESTPFAWKRSVCTSAGIGDGSAGFISTTIAADFRVDGALFTLGASADHWDLSAETDTIAAQYRAYALLVDASGVASFESGDNSTSENAAIDSLAVTVSTKSRIGVYVAGPSTDFNAGGGLAGQGSYFDGWPRA